jgi:hypothetical protein
MPLPFAEREYIDPARTCRILGVSWMTARRLWQSGLIEVIEYRHRSWKRIRYHSVVEFCDNLRVKFSIPDRRPQLSAPYLRHRDEDLLPFPLKESTTGPQAMTMLGLRSTRSLLNLIEEGRFEAYQLIDSAPWRIHIPSLVAYIEKIRSGSQDTRYAYRKSPPDADAQTLNR